VTLSLGTVQKVLVLSALAWAILPTWGGYAFLAAWVLLAIGSAQRQRKARALLAEHRASLGNFPEETNRHLDRHALSYVWPQVAEKWGTTWQMAGLLCIIEGMALSVRAALGLHPSWLLFLLPLAAGVLVGGAMGRRIKIAERVKEDLKGDKPVHDALTTVIKLKGTMGQWPPAPPPEGD